MRKMQTSEQNTSTVLFSKPNTTTNNLFIRNVQAGIEVSKIF